MSDLDAIRDALRGEVEPLAFFGVTVRDVPWWRRRIQRYVMPNRFRLWWQRQVLEDLERPASE